MATTVGLPVEPAKKETKPKEPKKETEKDK